MISSLVLAVLAVGGSRSFGVPYLMATLQNKEIAESSGVAPAYLSPGCYFTHNDSGDKARLFRFDGKGRVPATYTVENASAVDCEDMASAKLDGKAYLFLGDVGDNQAKRKSITVYRIPEPTGASARVRADAVYELTYPDGPHNAETLMVHPKTGDLVIVAKTDKERSKVFRLPRPGSSGKYAMKEVGWIRVPAAIGPMRLTTGGAISPDGRYVIVRTYLAAFEYDVPARFDEWVKSRPRPVVLNAERQGEAVTYSVDGKRIVTTSEGSPCRVSAVPVRG